MTHDLSFLLDPPDLTARAVLTVEALAPLSMVAELPGHYFRSQPAPTDAMLLGLFENALGWHFDDATRRDALKTLAKEAKKRHRKGPWKDHPWLSGKAEGPASGYLPLLAHHVVFETTRILPPVMTYDDCWSQNLHDTDSSRFFGGSRHYDAGLEPTINRSKQGHVSFKQAADHETIPLDQVGAAPDGSKLHFKSIRTGFPHYYATPKQREYVVPTGPYRFGVRTTPALAAHLARALDAPAAPLYLGSSDGWVDASWEVRP